MVENVSEDMRRAAVAKIRALADATANERTKLLLGWAASEIEAHGQNDVPPGHVEIITNGTRRIIPEDEPVFLLRGRDPLAYSTVLHWSALAHSFGIRPEQIEIARAHAEKMRQWPVKQIPGQTRLAEEG